MYKRGPSQYNQDGTLNDQWNAADKQQYNNYDYNNN